MFERDECMDVNLERLDKVSEAARQIQDPEPDEPLVSQFWWVLYLVALAGAGFLAFLVAVSI